MSLWRKKQQDKDESQILCTTEPVFLYRNFWLQSNLNLGLWIYLLKQTNWTTSPRVHCAGGHDLLLGHFKLKNLWVFTFFTLFSCFQAEPEPDDCSTPRLSAKICKDLKWWKWRWTLRIWKRNHHSILWEWHHPYKQDGVWIHQHGANYSLEISLDPISSVYFIAHISNTAVQRALHHQNILML